MPGKLISNTLLTKNNYKTEKIEDLTAEIQYLFQKIQNYPISKESYISSSEVYKSLGPILDSNIKNVKNLNIFLSIYRDLLKRIITTFREEYLQIDNFLSAVNIFLEGKKIEIFKANTHGDNSLIKIRFDDGSLVNSLDLLSSGERQILTIIYAATYMSNEKLVMIDEPEISLHIDWQRLLLKKISEQLSGRQIIACTHSPIIPADYDDYLMELQSKITDKNLWGLDELKDENKLMDDDINDFDEYNFIVDNKEIL